MDIRPFTMALSEEVSLKDCMSSIERNHGGFVILTTPHGQVEGVLTDGDIRRALLNGASTESLAGEFVNRKFAFGQAGASREKLLKLLDSSFQFLPILRDGVLEDLLTLKDLKYAETTECITRAKAPARISFGGGGTDMTPFFQENGGAVLNATINMFSHATLKKHASSRSIKITSRDYGLTVEATSIEHLNYDGKLDLIKAGIKLLDPDFGFELEISSDFPPNSGLGGSSVVLAAVIGAINKLRRVNLNSYDIAELAFQAERLELKCAGGWQDQYAAVFGGFNFMEFKGDRNEINSLRISDDIESELEERMLLCFSGSAHPENKIHKSQRVMMLTDAKKFDLSKKTRDLAYELKAELIRGNIDRFGELLHEGWIMKKSLDDGISNPMINEIYTYALQNGAVGGKILGAGGGGYFLFQSRRDTRESLKQALIDRGLQVRDINFDRSGLRAWAVRS
jgi:D-glycero-alpha-D-manno-heptose-7-phosphate kinase